MINGNRGEPEYNDEVYEHKIVTTEHHYYDNPQSQYDPHNNQS